MFWILPTKKPKRNLAKYPHGSVICAATQTSGKGRLGRIWSSPPNKNIYMSIVIKRNDLSPSAVNSFVQLAALSIYNSLKEMSISGLKIKWPNDVLVNGAKIAGILCEGVFKQDKMTALIIGIGLNVNMNVKDLSKIGRPATSLLVESSVPWNCLKIKNTLLEKFLCNYTLLDENKYKISELWLQAAKLKDKNVIFN